MTNPCNRRIRMPPRIFVAVAAALAMVLGGCTSHVSGTPTMTPPGPDPAITDACVIAPQSAVTTIDRRLRAVHSSAGTTCRYRDAAADVTLAVSSLNAADPANSLAALRSTLAASAPSLPHSANEPDLGADAFYLSGRTQDQNTWLSAVVWQHRHTVFELSLTAPTSAYMPAHHDLVALARRADAVATGRLKPAPPPVVPAGGSVDTVTGPGDPFPATGYLACLYLTPRAAQTLIPQAVHDVGVQDSGSYFDCGYDANYDQSGATAILTLMPAAATGNGSITEALTDQTSTGHDVRRLAGLGTGAFLSTTPSSGVLLDIYFVKDHYLFDLTGLGGAGDQTITPDRLQRLAALLYRSPTR